MYLFIYVISAMAVVTLNSYLVLLCFWVLSILCYAEQNTKFRNLNLYPSSDKMVGSTHLCPSDRDPQPQNNIGYTSKIFSAPAHKYRKAISNWHMTAYFDIHTHIFFSNCRPIRNHLILATEIVTK